MWPYHLYSLSGVLHRSGYHLYLRWRVLNWNSVFMLKLIWHNSCGWITLDLTHWAAWGDLLSIWKQKDSLPSRGNCVVFGYSTGRRGKVVINCVKRGSVDVAWTLLFCLCGVTQEWISSIFEMSNVFWIAVLSLCWSWYDIIVGV